MGAFVVTGAVVGNQQTARYPIEVIEKMRGEWEPLANTLRTVEAIKILRTGGVDLSTAYEVVHAYQVEHNLIVKHRTWWQKLWNRGK